jgi:hypothetical protein
VRRIARAGDIRSDRGCATGASPQRGDRQQPRSSAGIQRRRTARNHARHRRAGAQSWDGLSKSAVPQGTASIDEIERINTAADSFVAMCAAHMATSARALRLVSLSQAG